MSIRDFVNKFYEAYENQTPETYFDSIRNMFSVKGICETEEQDKQCQQILDKYEGKKLYVYCCGSLLPTPDYHDDVCVKLIEELGTVVCAECLD